VGVGLPPLFSSVIAKAFGTLCIFGLDQQSFFFDIKNAKIEQA
jgi:hypothetical protein